MERLTNRNYGEISHTGRIIPYSKHCIGCITKDCDCGIVEDMVEKLANYEDLEEQGRLVKLPCKVGDVVYVKMASYCKTHYVEAEVRDFVHFISCGFCAVVTSKYFDKENIPFSEFGKTIFLTKEEVEAKLKELRGGEDG